MILRAILATMLVAIPIGSETISGAAGVVDGDTIAIGKTKIRLEGIDCPEAGQMCRAADGSEWACGLAATDMTIRLADRKAVMCDVTGTDRYGRKLATCRVGDEPSINAQLVRAGLAYAFRRYSHAYDADEAVAREARLGVWAADNETPWDYRRRMRQRSHRP